MTRLAATAGATPEETLSTAESVPSVEGVDINDGWIIDKTQQVDCGNGLMKYVIALPGDPTPFECSPFQVDMRRDMIKLWMGAVRSAIVERAGAAAARTRETALKAKREREMGTAGIQIADTIPTAEAAALIAKSLNPRPADPAIADRIVHQMREMKKPPAEGEAADLVEAKKQLAMTKANLAYWKAMVKALEPAPAKAAAVVIHTAPTTRAGKLARTLQT